MVQLDPRLHSEWPDRVVLCWDASYSLTTYKRLVEAWLGDSAEVPGDVIPDKFGPVVPAPEGFLVAVEYGSPGLLPWMLERVAAQQVAIRQVYVLPEVPESVSRVTRLGEPPSVMTWLVPVRRSGDAARRTPPSWPAMLVSQLGNTRRQLLSVDAVRRGLVDPRAVEETLRRYLDVGAWMALFDDTGPPDDCPVAVLLTTLSGDQLVGIGRVGDRYAQPGPVREAVARSSKLLTSVADELEYAVVGVHWTSSPAQAGSPFTERRPPTGGASLLEVAVSAAERVALDAGPVQVLSDIHEIRPHPDVVQTSLSNRRRLVQIGDPEAWAPARELDAMVSLGRQVLASYLPDRDELAKWP